MDHDLTGQGGTTMAERMQAFVDFMEAQEGTGTVHCINLVKFKPAPEYPEGHPLASSGLSCEELYAQHWLPACEATGFAKAFYLGSALPGAFAPLAAPEGSELNPGDWDAVFIVEYENPRAIAGLIQSDLFSHPSAIAPVVVQDQRWLPFLPTMAAAKLQEQ